MKRVYGQNGDVDLRLLYTEEHISAQVSRLAGEISADYAGEELLLIVVLKGAFIFAADLARLIRIPSVVDFVKLSSYRGTETTGSVLLEKDTEIPLQNKNVLVIEDIVDTGLSLAFLMENFRRRGPKSLKVCTLIDKRGRRRSDVSTDYVGISCEAGFLVGYGLDLDERCREFPAIYEIEVDPSHGGLNGSSM